MEVRGSDSRHQQGLALSGTQTPLLLIVGSHTSCQSLAFLGLHLGHSSHRVPSHYVCLFMWLSVSSLLIMTSLACIDSPYSKPGQGAEGGCLEAD